MECLELIAVGEDCGLVLPQELLNKLRVSLGDEIHMTETERGFVLSSGRSDSRYWLWPSAEKST